MGAVDSGEGVSKIMSSRTSRSSWEACDSVSGDFTGVREGERSSEGGGIAIESLIDRLGTTEFFSFGVERSEILISGPMVCSGGELSMMGVISGGGAELVRTGSGEIRAERRGFRSGVAGAAVQGV